MPINVKDTPILSEFKGNLELAKKLAEETGVTLSDAIGILQYQRLRNVIDHLKALQKGW